MSASLGSASGDGAIAPLLELRTAPMRPALVRTLYRFRWLALWAACVVTFIALVGFPGSRSEIFAVMGVGLIASGAATEAGTRWKRVVVDWFPFYVLLTLYDM